MRIRAVEEQALDSDSHPYAQLTERFIVGKEIKFLRAASNMASQFLEWSLTTSFLIILLLFTASFWA
jgi:hypothetical protein